MIKGFVAGCEQCFTTISLIDFADDSILPEESCLFARAQLTRNQESLCLVQELVDVEHFMEQFKVLDVDMDNLVNDGEKTDGEGKLMNASTLDGKGVATMR